MDGSLDPIDGEDHRNAATWWAAIYTHPRRENVAAENLLRQEFQIYFPRELKRVRHARRITDVRRPLFPGYIFVRVARRLAMWRPILSTVGVRDLVRTGGRPALLDGEFIEGLRAREIDGLIVRPASPYQLDQEVRLTGGPFDGLIGRIVEMSDENRLVLLTSLLQQQVRMKVTPANVRAL